MFSWLAGRRRKKLTQESFPPAWEDIIRNNVAHYCMLDDVERAHLRALVKVFVAEKDWEGCGGLELTDEIRVTVSAQACLLLLGLPHNYYQNVETIVVYPSTVVPPRHKLGFFETALAPVEDSRPIIGQAFQTGACHYHLGCYAAWRPSVPNWAITLSIMNLPTSLIC